MYENYLVGFQKKKYSLNKWLLVVVFGMSALQGICQANTEIFLVELTYENETPHFLTPVNISNNAGYDNQPSFYADSLLLFSSNRADQTDIAAYSLDNNTIRWLSNTPDGSEYSPLKIPNNPSISAIRLDKDGTQLLYSYPYNGATSKVLLNGLKVGYHTWFTDAIIVSAVLVDDGMNLVVSNQIDGSSYTFQKNVGRSLHKIPNTQLISFISKEEDKWLVKSINPISGASEILVALPQGVQDVCWLMNGTLLAGKENRILKYTPGLDNDWTLLQEFPVDKVANITRLASNSLSTRLAFAAELPDHK